MEVQEDTEVTLSSMKLIRVNYGDVFHMADDTFDEALAENLFYSLLDIPISDDICHVVHISTGSVIKLHAGNKVICHPSKLLVSRELEYK